MRTTSVNAKSSPSLVPVIAATKKLWRQYHLTYDQTHYVAKEVRRALAIERPKTRKRVVARLSREDERRLIGHAYRMQGTRGLLIKTLFQTGARVSEFVNITAEELFFDEQMILLSKAKGGKSRYVPILPELAQELRTHLGNRTVGYLFETIHHTPYFVPENPTDHQRDRGGGQDYEARVSPSSTPFCSHHPPRARHAHRANPKISGPLQAGDDPNLCGILCRDD
jgi:integrase